MMKHTTPFLILLPLLFAACGGEEDYPPPSGGCSEAFDLCAGERVCIDSTCQSAFPRIYRATLEVVLPQRDPNGECWDVGCGLPDPFVVVYVNNAEKARTQVVQDSLTASWEPGDIELVAGSSLQFDVYDSDVSDHDFAMGCRIEAINAEVARARTHSCGEAGVSTVINVLLEPKG